MELIAFVSRRKERLALALLPFLFGAAGTQESPRLAPVEITTHLVAPADLPAQAEIILRPADGEDKDVRRLPLTFSAPLSLRLPAGSRWEVSADLPGFWVRRKELAVGAADELTRLALDLWPLGTISGVVKVKGKGVALPRQLLVKTLASPAFRKRPDVPPGALNCSVDLKGAWSCSLPAATFDLVFTAEGLTPQYRWGVKVPAGKKLSLGTIELERGASVAGWVAVEEGAIDPRQCVVRLALLLAGGTDLSKAAELERTSVEKTVRGDGFFQLTGLAPGVYALEVRQPGYNPVKLSPVQVNREAETFLRDPLVLTHPLDLAFAINPPLDWLGKPWRAKVFRVRDGRIAPVVFNGTADGEGRFSIPGQSPGQYRVEVLDSLGNRLHSSDDIQMDAPGLPAFPIEIKFIDLKGELLLGGEPLQGVLLFGGRRGTTSVRMEADEEGRFFGPLPREGFWNIDIEAAHPRLQTRTRAEVQAGASGVASLKIDLPDTRIFGRVSDEQGKPVPDAHVVIQGKSLDQQVSTDSAGAFELRGLAEGPVTLGAESASRNSDIVHATLAAGHAAGPIDLVLRPVKRLTGHVLSSRGPVAGSSVTVMALPPSAGGRTGTTDMEGAFDIAVPEAAGLLTAIVSAPGYALRAFGPVTGGPLSLGVSEEAGTLEIVLPGSGEDLLRKNLSVAIFQNGFPIPMGLLRQWAYNQGVVSEGKKLRVPNVVPGEYRTCLVPRGHESAGDAGGVCDTGLLAVGGTLSLHPGLPP